MDSNTYTYCSTTDPMDMSYYNPSMIRPTVYKWQQSMIKCSYCGTKAPEDESNCPKCGAPMPLENIKPSERLIPEPRSVEEVQRKTGLLAWLARKVNGDED